MLKHKYLRRLVGMGTFLTVLKLVLGFSLNLRNNVVNWRMKLLSKVRGRRGAAAADLSQINGCPALFTLDARL